MKTFMLILFAGFLMTSCYIDSVEPRYDSRDRVVGRYDVEEYSRTFDDYTYYTIHISKSGPYNEIYLDNFYAADIGVYANVKGDRITIPYQVVNGYEIEGAGNVYGSTIDFTYSVYDRYGNSHKDFCETHAY